VQIRLQFVPESSEKPITISHPIKLHHWGAPIEGLIPANPAVAPSAPATAASTPAAAGPSESAPAPPSETAPIATPDQTSETKDGDGDVKMEDPSRPFDPNRPCLLRLYSLSRASYRSMRGNTTSWSFQIHPWPSTISSVTILLHLSLREIEEHGINVKIM
jgi:hypothetical protein